MFFILVNQVVRKSINAVKNCVCLPYKHSHNVTAINPRLGLCKMLPHCCSAKAAPISFLNGIRRVSLDHIKITAPQISYFTILSQGGWPPVYIIFVLEKTRLSISALLKHKHMTRSLHILAQLRVASRRNLRSTCAHPSFQPLLEGSKSPFCCLATSSDSRRSSVGHGTSASTTAGSFPRARQDLPAFICP